MVSLDQIHSLDFQYQWIVAAVLTLASTISMVSGLLYCMCFGTLFRGSASMTDVLNPTSAVLSQNKKNKKKTRRAKAKGISPAVADTHSVPVQVADTSKLKPKQARKVQHKLYLGKLQLHMQYVKCRSALEVRVLCAQNLPAKDVNGSSDPYCKLLLLPARDKKISTKVKPRTRSPLWNETVVFVVMPSELMEQTLYVYVLDHDHLSKDDMIGECRFNLCNVDLAHGQMLWRELSPSQGYASYLGEILLSLCFSASQEKLTINILKCTNLKAMDSNQLSDPYVKVFLWQGGKKTSKKKTSTKTKTRNPVFNESFTFEIALTKIHSSQILVEVMDYDRMSANDKIGCVLLGEGDEDIAAMHWSEMCNHMDKPCALWHRLKKEVDS